MISQRETDRRYNRIINYYKDSKPMGINCYVCTCGKIIKSIDINPGTTPMFIGCECGGQMSSTWYKDISPETEISIEFYRPSLKEVMKFRKNQNRMDHILNGGLEMRKILARDL